MMDGETDEGAIVMWCVHNETAESAGRINGGGGISAILSTIFFVPTLFLKNSAESFEVRIKQKY